MAYAFDGRALGQVLVETERLAEQSRDHERRLARLVLLLEGPSQPMNSDLLLEIRHLCVNTRDQRQQLEAMLARLVGTPPEDHALPVSSGARVMIADDSSDNRDRSARVLESSGFAKCASMSASRPLAAVIAANPDDSRARADRSRFSGESSAIRTRAPGDAGRRWSSGGVPTRRDSIASSCCR